MTCAKSLIVSIVVAISVLYAGAADAADAVVRNTDSHSHAVSASEILRAKAFTNPLRPPVTSSVRAEGLSTQYAPAAVFPTTSGSSTGQRAESSGGWISLAYGSFGIPYTSRRVQLGTSNAPSAGTNYLSTTDPYRTIGKLTFSAGYCTASLIRRSVIVTAAHCIQDFGSGANLFSNFRFTPGHFGAGKPPVTAQIAPYGTWTWKALVRPGSWANGTDLGSGAARDNDLAVIALAKDSSGRFVGDLTGYLGYAWNNYSFVASPRTGNLAVAVTSTLGYSFLLDSGAIMQRADGPTYRTTIAGAGQLWQGSNFTAGSSGGPWVVNFGAVYPVLSGGAAWGTSTGMAIVGVTSWGSDDPNAPKDNYASQFRQNSRYPLAAYGIYGAGNIGALLYHLCSAGSGDGTPTFAQAGYCN